MNLLKLCFLLTLAVAGASVQAASSSSSSGASEDVQAPITKAELDAIITEIKAAVAADPSLADIFNGIDFDELLKLTPDEVRAKLNALVFEATPKPTSNATESKDAQAGSSAAPVTVPTTTTTPAPTTSSASASSVFTATAAISVASVVTYVMY